MVALAATLATFAFSLSIPGGDFELWAASGGVLVFAVIAWAIAVVWAVVRGQASVLRRPLTWAAPVALLIAVAMEITSAPMQIRYTTNKSEMNAAVKAVAADPSSAAKIDRIGNLRVEEVQRIPGGMRFLVKDSGWLDPAGFAYSADGEPRSYGEDLYEPLSDGWWVWTASW